MVRKFAPSFLNNLKTLLLDPPKNKLGIISKTLLDKINLIFETQSKSINERRLMMSTVSSKSQEQEKLYVYFI